MRTNDPIHNLTNTVHRMAKAAVPATAALAVALGAAGASAETWIAECNSVQFNFQRDNDRFLVYFDTDAGTLQVAKGKITFDNGTAVRGPVSGNDSYIGAGGGSNNGPPISQIGLNRSRNIVYVLYQHPRNDTQKSGTFCSTEVDTGPHGAQSGGSSAGWHSVVIDSAQAAGATGYTLKRGGKIKQVSGKLAGHRVTKQSNDHVSGRTAQGRVGAGKDGFRVDGKLPVIQLDDPTNATVYVDGKPAHTVVIDGTDAPGRNSDYTLIGKAGVQQVAGRLDGHQVTVDSGDRVSGRVANGKIWGKKDGYLVYGPIDRLQMADPNAAQVYVDGAAR